jgi:hypothetical protein
MEAACCVFRNIAASYTKRRLAGGALTCASPGQRPKKSPLGRERAESISGEENRGDRQSMLQERADGQFPLLMSVIRAQYDACGAASRTVALCIQENVLT